MKNISENKLKLLQVSFYTFIIAVFTILLLYLLIINKASSESHILQTETLVYVCGNDIREEGEVCDGTDVMSLSCVSFGYDNGDLTCYDNCQSFDTSDCGYDIICGNDVREDGEVCDGTDLNDQSCTTLGYDGGDLSCTSNCQSFNINNCYSNEPEPTSYCGNSIKEIGEACDGSDLNSQTCISLGYNGGNLTCLDNCQSFDTSSCYSDEEPEVTSDCGNKIKESGELCDGNDLGGETCISLGYDYGLLECNNSCNSFVTSGCKYYSTVIPKPSLCGNGIIDSGEACDGDNLNNETCASFAFDGGELSCSSDCSLFITNNCNYGYEICDNKIDDDNNSFADCYDSVCMTLPACLSQFVDVCYNGIDDDNDSYLDCYDSDCLNYEYCFNKLGENCSNDLDDNNNGLVDCEDEVCLNHQSCYKDEVVEEEEEEIIEIIPGVKTSSTGIIIILTIIVLLIFLIIFILFYFRKKKDDEELDENINKTENDFAEE